MIESAHNRDGEKEVETQDSGTACNRDNKCFSENGTNPKPNQGKSGHSHTLPTSELESISGEFALVISGHSLVSDVFALYLFRFCFIY